MCDFVGLILLNLTVYVSAINIWEGHPHWEKSIQESHRQEVRTPFIVSLTIKQDTGLKFSNRVAVE